MKLSLQVMGFVFCLMISGCTKDMRVMNFVQQQYENSSEKSLNSTFGKNPKGLARDLRALVARKQSVSFGSFSQTGDTTEGTIVVKHVNQSRLAAIVYPFGLAQSELDDRKLTLNEAWTEMKRLVGAKNLPNTPDDLPVAESRFHFVVKKQGEALQLASLSPEYSNAEVK